MKKTSKVFWLVLFGILVVGFTGHCFAAEKNPSPEEIFKQAKLKHVDKQNSLKEVNSLIVVLRKTKPTIKFKGDSFVDFSFQSPEAERLVKIGEGAVVPLIKELARGAKLIKEENYDDIVEPGYILRILLKIGKPKVVPHLIRFLSTGNVDERRLAAETFVYGFVDESALPALIQTLKDKDNLVRYTATTALGILGMKEAIPALKEALQDKVKYIREEAKRAIEEIQEQDEQVTKAYPLNYSSPQEIKESLEKTLKQPYEKRKIVCDKKQNCLIITDSVSNHKVIKELIAKLDQPKPQFRIKITKIETKENGEQVVNSQEVIALLDTPANINIENKTTYWNYKVTPSLTGEGTILLKVEFEIGLRSKKREIRRITGGKRQYILKDRETKDISGSPGSKRKTIIFAEKIKPKRSTTVTDEKIQLAKGQSKISLSFGQYWLQKVSARFTGENISLRIFIFKDGKLSQSETKNVRNIKVRNAAGEEIEGVKFAIKNVTIGQKSWWLVISMKTNSLVPGVYRIKAIFKDGQESEVSEIKLVNRKIDERLKEIKERLTEKIDKICKACEKGNKYEENFKLLCKAGESGGISLLSKENKEWIEENGVDLKNWANIRWANRIWKDYPNSVSEAAKQLLCSRVHSTMSDCGWTIACSFGKLRDKRAIPCLKKMMSYSDGGFSEDICMAIEKCGGDLKNVKISHPYVKTKNKNLSAEDIFKQAEFKRSQIKSIEMEYEIEVETKRGEIQKQTIQLLWRKPNLAKLVLSGKDGHKHINIFDGKVQWEGNEEDSGGEITRIDLSKLSEEEKSKIRKMKHPGFRYLCCGDNIEDILPDRLFLKSKPKAWKFQEVKTGHFGKVYFLTAKRTEDKAKLWLGCKDGLIHKLEFPIKGGIPYMITLKKLNVDQPIPQKRFTYQPPPGVKIKEIIAEEFIKQLGIKKENIEAFEKARQDALLSRCKSNMRQIVMAIKMYVADHDKYPDKLSDLYPEYFTSLQGFTCPATGDKITSKKEIDAKGSYEYRGAGLEEKDQDKIILIEKNYNHTIDGKPVRCIGYADGHVATETEKSAVKIETIE